MERASPWLADELQSRLSQQSPCKCHHRVTEIAEKETRNYRLPPTFLTDGVSQCSP